jgi:DNA polymerase V
MDHVFALVDCENFYVSCERVFDPSLRTRPVVVLSNNDGCIIARSQAVKAAGVPMGAPYFQWKDALADDGVAVRSSNYTLYGDMSRRVMTELEAVALEVERYSIDEAFLTLPALDRRALHDLAERLRRRIRQHQGVPIRVGIGPTKTLAKIADTNAKARKRADQGSGTYVCPPEPERAQLLQCVPVGDVWGIGSAYTRTLNAEGITTAAGFRDLPDAWIRQAMGVVGLRTAWELRGRSCLPLDDVGPDRKTLVRSRSFSGRVTEKRQLQQALAKHAQRAAEKLRAEALTARGLQVFVTTKRFGPPPHYSNAAAGTLPGHTADARPFLRAARRLLDQIHVSAIDGREVGYKKAGVLLYDIRPADAGQTHLFSRSTPEDQALMDAVDQINAQMGRGTVGFASAGAAGSRSWTMKREMRSPRYTTRWDELPIAHG